MSEYEIKILPTHNEVVLRGRIDRLVVGTILEALRGTDGFPDRNAIWVLEETVEPPSFDEFESIAHEIRRYLPTARVDKRVGLVGGFGTMSSILELWRTAATDLPFKMEVFQEYENAVHWVT